MIPTANTALWAFPFYAMYMYLYYLRCLITIIIFSPQNGGGIGLLMERSVEFRLLGSTLFVAELQLPQFRIA